MTTIVSRLYPDHETAKAAYDALVELGCSDEELAIIESGGDTAHAMEAAGVPPRERGAYAEHLVDGRALVVVRARFGSAFIVGAALDEFASIEVPDVAVGMAHYAPEDTVASSVLKGSPLFLTNPNDGMSGFLAFGGDPIIRRPPSGSIMKAGSYMSRYFWPMKLISPYTQKNSAIRGGFLFSSLFGLPTLSKRRA